MEWLQTHWLALAGIGAMFWIADRFLETLTTLTGLMGLVDMLTVMPRRSREKPR